MSEIITMAKKAADAWRNTDTYHQAAQIIDMLVEELEQTPTITPPNEWISVEDRLPEPGDLIVYADNTVWGYQYGICRVCGKEKAFDYWIPLQDPPNNSPPEGEVDGK